MSNGWERYKLPNINEQRKDWDRAQGAKRWEITIPVGTLVRWFHKLFDKRRAK